MASKAFFSEERGFLESKMGFFGRDPFTHLSSGPYWSPSVRAIAHLSIRSAEPAENFHLHIHYAAKASFLPQNVARKVCLDIFSLVKKADKKCGRGEIFPSFAF